MADESIIPRLEEWMECMAFYIPPDDMKRISSDEKLKPILNALITRVHPKDIVKRAKIISLCKKQNNKESRKEFELMKKRNKLKEQLELKEEEFVEKKKEYTNLLKENENLLQEIQWTDRILNDEKKKLLFLLLNEKALGNTTVQYQLLRQSVHETEMENRKRENSGLLLDPNEVKEAVFECQAYIMNTRKKMAEQLENIKNITSEYDCSSTNTVALEWKAEVIEYVSKKLHKFPLNRVFEVLLEQQQHFINSVQLLLSCTNSDEALLTRKNNDWTHEKKTLESIFFISNYVEMNGLMKNIKPEANLKLLVNDDTTSVTRHSEDSVCSSGTDDSKLSKSNLLDIENRIVEKAVECKNVKLNLKTNLTEVLRRLSGIKQFSRRLRNSNLQNIHKEDTELVPQRNDLYNCMEELCKLGPMEIQLFADLPLVALEKLSMENAKSVPIYELHSSYLRVLSNTSKNYKSTFSVMKDASGWAPCSLLLHVWKQLSYLEELRKAHSVMKPYAGTCVNLRVATEEISEKLEKIYDNFLRILSPFASKTDEIATFLEMMRNHPLAAVVPRHLLVGGQSIEFYIKMFNKPNEQNENENCSESFEGGFERF